MLHSRRSTWPSCLPQRAALRRDGAAARCRIWLPTQMGNAAVALKNLPSGPSACRSERLYGEMEQLRGDGLTPPLTTYVFARLLAEGRRAELLDLPAQARAATALHRSCTRLMPLCPRYHTCCCSVWAPTLPQSSRQFTESPLLLHPCLRPCAQFDAELLHWLAAPVCFHTAPVNRFSTPALFPRVCSLTLSFCTGWAMLLGRSGPRASSCCGCTSCAWGSMVGGAQLVLV